MPSATDLRDGAHAMRALLLGCIYQWMHGVLAAVLAILPVAVVYSQNKRQCLAVDDAMLMFDSYHPTLHQYRTPDCYGDAFSGHAKARLS